MAKKTPKSNPKSAPVRRKGPQRPRPNPTKNGKIFGNWQSSRKGGR